jgi:hypothetical protein
MKKLDIYQILFGLALTVVALYFMLRPSSSQSAPKSSIPTIQIDKLIWDKTEMTIGDVKGFASATGFVSAAEKNGRLEVSLGCRPERPDFCSAEDQVRILRFRRDGNQIRPFAVGIDQTLDADVSEYTSLRLTAWVRVLTQTVPLAGIAGSECPVMFKLTFKTIRTRK